jgi:hypothetical protein
MHATLEDAENRITTSRQATSKQCALPSAYAAGLKQQGNTSLQKFTDFLAHGNHEACLIGPDGIFVRYIVSV